MQVLNRDQWLEVIIPAHTSLPQMFEAISAAPRGLMRPLLIDGSAADIDDPTAHAILGDHLAAHLHSHSKIAMLVPESIVSYNAERVARRRGVEVRTFTARADAENWLVAADETATPLG